MSIQDFVKEHSDHIWNMLIKMNSFGPRYTGNDAHQQYIQFIKEQLKEMKLPVYTDQHQFDRWEVLQARLSVDMEGKPVQIPVLSYYPYSGVTPEAGVSGELVFCKNKRQFKKAAGKIAVINVNNILLPTRLIFHPRKAAHFLPAFMRHCVVGSTLLGPNLTDAGKFGVIGVICVWKHCTDAEAKGQYLPFTTPLQNCPALWVGEKAGKELKRMAKEHGKARIVLTARIEKEAVSETIYTMIPGKNSAETILINTHTDGPNACEENGGIALLALADYYAGLPIQNRNKTLCFIFATGHFQIPQFGIDGKQATSRWLHMHEELWDGRNGNKKAIAGLTLEHLGCMTDTEKDNDSSNTERNPEIEFVYTSDEQMEKVYRDAVTDRTKIRSVTLKPGKFYFGEGEPLYQAGIPTISLVPAPWYLCSEVPGGHLEKMDRDLMLQQIATFANMIDCLDS